MLITSAAKLKKFVKQNNSITYLELVSIEQNEFGSLTNFVLYVRSKQAIQNV